LKENVCLCYANVVVNQILWKDYIRFHSQLTVIMKINMDALKKREKKKKDGAVVEEKV